MLGLLKILLYLVLDMNIYFFFVWSCVPVAHMPCCYTTCMCFVPATHVYYCMFRMCARHVICAHSRYALHVSAYACACLHVCVRLCVHMRMHMHVCECSIIIQYQCFNLMRALVLSSYLFDHIIQFYACTISVSSMLV